MGQKVAKVHHGPFSFRPFLPLEQLQPEVCLRIYIGSLIGLRQSIHVQVRFEGLISVLEEEIIVNVVGLLIYKDLLDRDLTFRQLLCFRVLRHEIICAICQVGRRVKVLRNLLRFNQVFKVKLFLSRVICFTLQISICWRITLVFSILAG